MDDREKLREEIIIDVCAECEHYGDIDQRCPDVCGYKYEMLEDKVVEKDEKIKELEEELKSFKKCVKNCPIETGGC